MSDCTPQAKQFVDDTSSVHWLPLCSYFVQERDSPCFELFTWKKAKQETPLPKASLGITLYREALDPVQPDRITCWSCEAESQGNKMPRSLQGSQMFKLFTFSGRGGDNFSEAFLGLVIFTACRIMAKALFNVCVWDRGSRTILTVVRHYAPQENMPMLIQKVQKSISCL